MDLTKTIIINGADGTPIVFTYDSVVTQWHEEEMSKAIRPYMKYYNTETKKIDAPAEQLVEMNEAQDAKRLQVYIRTWNKKDSPLTVENIKRSLMPKDFNQLVNTLKKLEDADWNMEKKSLSPKDSSNASTPNDSQMAQ